MLYYNYLYYIYVLREVPDGRIILFILFNADKNQHGLNSMNDLNVSLLIDFCITITYISLTYYIIITYIIFMS